MMRRLVECGIANFKCSTSLELLTVCEAGASDVLVAYPMVGANAVRVQEVAQKFANIDVSALVESREHIEAWRGSRVGLFIDVNPGMNRTGIEECHAGRNHSPLQNHQNAGLVFRADYITTTVISRRSPSRSAIASHIEGTIA
jgi:D-serine deaminase-like pyridoxal phosphate-dependent protein